MGNLSKIMENLMIKRTPQSFLNVNIEIPTPKDFEPIYIQTSMDDEPNEEFSRSDFMKQLTSSKKINKPQDGEEPKKIKSRLKIIRKLEDKITLVQIKAKKTKRLTIKPLINKETISDSVVIKGTTVGKRVGKTKEKGNNEIKASAYYLANREKFIGFITKTYASYKKELDKTDSITCERDDNAIFSPMAHQKIVRDYISKYTPYRGVLLFHGLGSGKTCSSIAITEGLKTDKQIIIMTPASLQMNYREELKKCGDLLYVKNQFWEFVRIDESDNSDMLITQLSGILGLTPEIVREKKGAWLVNVTKPTNYNTLTTREKQNLDIQITSMLDNKYKFINYNGIRQSVLSTLSKNGKINPFDNKVLVIDEAHNFVSRIVNKLGRKNTLSGDLYNYIMSAKNARIVLLTGTPIINYPNEVSILFNMLRGFIKTWSFKLNIGKKGTVNQKYFDEIFNNKTKSGAVMDYIHYDPSSSTLRVTRNPFGFVGTTRSGNNTGNKLDKRGEIDDKMFEDNIVSILKKNKIEVSNKHEDKHKPLPDTLKEFKNYFIDDTKKLTKVKNIELFKRRILGLSSYFRDVDSLMPLYNKEKDFIVVELEMSDYQLGVYEAARVKERKNEMDNSRNRKKKKNKGPGIFEETVSTYRIFSRAYCNFVFPEEIKRPLPGKDEELDEDDIDGLSVEEKSMNSEGQYDKDDSENNTDKNRNYKKDIIKAITELDNLKEVYLNKNALLTYSPKFLNILENVSDEDHIGSHLIYSQFRTLEGIGILKLVFEANGYAEFKLKKKGSEWDIDIADADLKKPKFVLYTGSETADEKEIVRNVFNGAWKYVPSSIVTKLNEMHPDNLHGEIIKVIMITASGAEGISLKNVRYVHITEPYWHPVRIQQVIGRARRICSHSDLPIDERTVKVFLYLMKLSEEQEKSKSFLELRKKDQSKLIANTPYTSDQTLYEISSMKEKVTNEILQAVKEASFDCTIHAKSGGKEQVKCFTFGSNNPDKFSYLPSYEEEEKDDEAEKNKTVVVSNFTEITFGKNKYAFDENTMKVYILEDYNNGILTLKGMLKVTGEGKNKTYEIVE
tara:strand:- start:2111 stop:5323 length:3213 start_codon:yes stop_codon:yes gene_type:complete